MGVGLVEKGADSIQYTAYNDSDIGTCRDGKAEAIMPVLNIHNLSAEVHARLRIRSTRAGRSMETVLQDWVGELYGAKKPRKVAESLIAERRWEHAEE